MKEDRDGKQLISLYDVRGAIVTATATLTTGTAGSLVLGDSDYMLDLIEVTAATNSTTVAAGTGPTVDLISDGAIITTFGVPLPGSTTINYNAPLEQQTKNTPWNADLNDITGTTVTINARFIKRAK